MPALKFKIARSRLNNNFQHELTALITAICFQAVAIQLNTRTHATFLSFCGNADVKPFKGFIDTNINHLNGARVAYWDKFNFCCCIFNL